MVSLDGAQQVFEEWANLRFADFRQQLGKLLRPIVARRVDSEPDLCIQVIRFLFQRTQWCVASFAVAPERT